MSSSLRPRAIPRQFRSSLHGVRKIEIKDDDQGRARQQCQKQAPGEAEVKVLVVKRCHQVRKRVYDKTVADDVLAKQAWRIHINRGVDQGINPN